jgi:hypothetical protein
MRRSSTEMGTAICLGLLSKARPTELVFRVDLFHFVLGLSPNLLRQVLGARHEAQQLPRAGLQQVALRAPHRLRPRLHGRLGEHLRARPAGVRAPAREGEPGNREFAGLGAFCLDSASFGPRCIVGGVWVFLADGLCCNANR